MHHPRIRFAAAAGIALLLFAGAVSALEQERETFSALARHVGTGPSGQTSISINIDRWSSQEEHDHLVETLLNEDNQALADELGDMDTVGFLRVTGRAPSRGTGSWQLRYARQYEQDGVRIIRLASNRPILFVEAVRRPTRTWDAQTTLIELHVDENGEGEGVLMAGVEFTVDAKTNNITLSHLSSNPTRLEQVRSR